MKTIRLFLVSACMLLSAESVYAQLGRDMPQWVTNKPAANKAHHYYYRVTMGEAATYDEAYARAFAKAIMETNMKLGVRVSAATGEDRVTKDIYKQITMEDYSMEIPINKVCDFWEPLYYPKRIRLYVLWQIAESALQTPEFDEFNNCD